MHKAAKILSRRSGQEAKKYFALELFQSIIFPFTSVKLVKNRLTYPGWWLKLAKKRIFQVEEKVKKFFSLCFLPWKSRRKILKPMVSSNW